MNRLRTWLTSDIRIFLERGIWEIKTRSLSPIKAAGVRALRVPVLAVHDFLRDNCWMRASALTYYSLLGLVPLLAMVLGIARVGKFDAKIEAMLMEEFGAQREVLTLVLQFAQSMLENTKGGMVNGLWFLLLFWTVVRLFGNIEEAFNQIWGFKKGRSLMRKTLDYTAVAIIGPALWLPASASMVIISAQVEAITQLPVIQTFGPIIMFSLSFLPYVMIWVMFSCMYIFLPNGPIRWRSGILAGFVAGAAFQIFQIIYIKFQIGAARSNAVYGSFAALPLFLIWLYFSWVIVLFGAEVAYSHQHSEDNDYNPASDNASFFLIKTAALQIVHLLARDFAEGGRPRPEKEISALLDLPRGLVQRVLGLLESARLVVKTVPEKGSNSGWHPAVTLDKLTAARVLEGLDGVGVNALPSAENTVQAAALKTLEEFSRRMEESGLNRPLAEMRQV